ncbi:MAG: ABC transporter permease [Nocardioides sp.]
MSWLRGWRPLLRLAWRDAVRHRARSALVLTLIALPVLAVTAADVLYQTQQLSGTEAMSRRLGAADARISVDPWSTAVQQWPDPDSRYGSSAGAPEGYRPATLADLGQALGRPLRGIELARTETRVLTDRGSAAVEASEFDLGDPLAQGLFHIDEGRAPTDDSEVVVNHDLASRGPGLGDQLQVVDGPTLRVVGVGESTSTYGYPLLVALPGAIPSRGTDGTRSWLVDAGGPVSWADVRALNALGATVLSRAVLEQPPPAGQIPAELRAADSGTSSQTLAVLGLIVSMVLLEVVLLAGPAFAVGARRQSRELALMSATGGTPSQSRRTILASALVLGSAGAALGVLGGLAVARLARPLVQRLSHEWFGPYDVAWAHVGLVAAFGLLSALLAAAVPAWIASRQDVVAVLAGRRGDRRAGLRSPALGALLVAAGVAASAYGTQAQGNGELMIAFAAVVSVLGMIMLVPLLLVGLARLSGRLPLALRFAVRDAARHRTRTVPAVAAVAATVAGVVALGIANTSDAKEGRATYAPCCAPATPWSPPTTPPRRTGRRSRRCSSAGCLARQSYRCAVSPTGRPRPRRPRWCSGSTDGGTSTTATAGA